MQTLFDLRQMLSDQGILISFNGPFSHSIIEELGKAVKHYLETEDVRKSAMMDVFSVYIEATQNVRNYGARSDFDESIRTRVGSGIIVIGKEGEAYVVRSGNLVRAEDGALLMARLEELSGMDKAALKARYKEQMRREVPEGGHGAGLGLIDMARKASAPLEYSLIPERDGYAFFSLGVRI
jgi:hypothetical protein